MDKEYTAPTPQGQCILQCNFCIIISLHIQNQNNSNKISSKWKAIGLHSKENT